MIADNITKENSEIIPPCYIGKGVVLKNTTVGPNVAIGEGSFVENSTISELPDPKKYSNQKCKIIWIHDWKSCKV